MKIKSIIRALLVSLAASVGVVAGAFAQKETREVKASSGDNLMLLISFDASGIGREWRGQCSNFRIHLWGTNDYDKTFQFHESGYEDLFFYNLALNTASQQISGYEFIFDQNGSPKYSQVWNASDVTKFYNSSANNGRAIDYYFDEGEWTDGKWPSGHYLGYQPTIDYPNPDGSSMQRDKFMYDIQVNRFESRPFHITENNIDQDVIINLRQRPQIEDYAYSLFSSDELIIKGSSENSIRFKKTGNYSLFINNITKTIEVDGVESKGCLEAASKSDSYVDYVYYVSQNASEDGHINAYTFSSTNTDTHSLGEWPGTSIEDLGAVKVSLINGFRFQNNSVNVYKIPINHISSLRSDDSIIFNFTGDAYGQTADLLFQNKATYWRGSLGNTVNLDAGRALDLFFDLQEVLSNVSSYRYNEMDLDNSICAISSSEAARLYTAYSNIASSVRVKYLDSSYVNVYASNGTDKEYISAYDVFQTLGERGGLINNSRVSALANLSKNDSAMIIAMMSVSIVFVGSVGAFIVLKKKKHVSDYKQS